MQASALPPLDARTIVCSQAGNVNSGASDPFAAIALRARDAGAWLHVDGAFGLFARACPWTATAGRRGRLLGRGLPQSSLSTTTQRPCRDARWRTRRAVLAYLVEGGALPASTELSPRAGSVGRSAWARRVARSSALLYTPTHFASGLPQLEILGGALNQVVVDLGGAERAQRITRALQADGRCWCGPTRWKGRPALRISVSSWKTTEADVERSLAAIVEIVRAG
jgi:selenocysteine lyase/cysteine desulfurase